MGFPSRIDHCQPWMFDFAQLGQSSPYITAQLYSAFPCFDPGRLLWNTRHSFREGDLVKLFGGLNPLSLQLVTLADQLSHVRERQTVRISALPFLLVASPVPLQTCATEYAAVY
jgi:hypothetical protein